VDSPPLANNNNVNTTLGIHRQASNTKASRRLEHHEGRGRRDLLLHRGGCVSIKGSMVQINNFSSPLFSFHLGDEWRDNLWKRRRCPKEIAVTAAKVFKKASDAPVDKSHCSVSGTAGPIGSLITSKSFGDRIQVSGKTRLS